MRRQPSPLLAAVALDPLRCGFRYGRRHRRRGPAPAAAAASSATAASAASSANAAAAAWYGRSALSRPGREADRQLALRRRRRRPRQGVERVHGLVSVWRRAWRGLACSPLRRRFRGGRWRRRGEGVRRCCRRGPRRARRCCILSRPWIGAVIHGDSSGVWVVQRSLSRWRAAVYDNALCECSAVRSVYGATPCTIDVIMRCYYRVYSSRGSFAGVLPRGDCRRAMPACSSITKVW